MTAHEIKQVRTKADDPRPHRRNRTQAGCDYSQGHSVRGKEIEPIGKCVVQLGAEALHLRDVA